MMVDVVQHGSTSLVDGLSFMRPRQLKAFQVTVRRLVWVDIELE